MNDQQSNKKSKAIDRIIVSTDCAKIASISRKYGAEVPFYRPQKLTGDKISKAEVCRHVIKLLNKKEAIKYENIIVLQPTSPLRTFKDIDKIIKHVSEIETTCDEATIKQIVCILKEIV